MACRRSWPAKRSSAKGGYRELRPAPPGHPGSLLEASGNLHRLEPWELQHVLFSLGYTDDLAGEAQIAAAVEVARGDWPQWSAA
jgi:hypothetical protein